MSLKIPPFMEQDLALDMKRMYVFFSDGKLAIRALYFYIVMSKWPDAKTFGAFPGPVLFRSKRKSVAVIMPLDFKDTEWPTEVTALLQRANAGEPRPTSDSPEEPQ